MSAPAFPDAPLRPGSPFPPATINNVARLLERDGIRCRYNEVKKKVEIDIPGHRGTLDNRDNVTMTHVVSLAATVGMPVGHVPEYVNAVGDRHAYNPVADWVLSREWDGVDRRPAFLATITAHPDYPTELKATLMTKWLRSAAAAAVVPGYRGRGVLTLQGGQGIGKTSWVKSLVTDPSLADGVVKLGHHLDAGNKDSQLGAIANWIVEIGELDSSLKRDIGRLKGFLTLDSDRVRRPYDRKESEYPRRTVFVATVNDGRFLMDDTGNSRFWTIATERIDHQHGIDMQQAFAQAAHEVRSGATWWLDDAEEAALAEWNGRHTAVSVIEELLTARLDFDRVGEPGHPAMTASETLRVLGIASPTNPQARECGAALRKLIGPHFRTKGGDKWRVPIREATAEDLNITGRRSPPPAAPPTDDGEIY